MNERLPEVRAVVFDLDGTLIDSMPLVLKAFFHALAPFRAPMTEAELFLRLGAPATRTLEELLDDPAHVAPALKRLQEFGRDGLGLIEEFPGMREMLALVRARGRSVSLWTGRDRFSSELILGGRGLTGAFDAIVCGDDLATHKPHPEGLLAIMAREGLAADEVLFLGDADVDVLAGAEAGVRTVLIRHGREIDAQVQAKSWRSVRTPAEAYAIVDAALG